MSARPFLIRADACAPACQPTARRGWAGGLMAALFIALASALLPGAIPASQMVGSAFNPATTQVALAREENERTGLGAPQRDRQQPETGSGDDGPAVATAQSAHPGPALSYPQPADIDRAGMQPPVTVFVLSGAGPRAPPAAA